MIELELVRDSSQKQLLQKVNPKGHLLNYQAIKLQVTRSSVKVSLQIPNMTFQRRSNNKSGNARPRNNCGDLNHLVRNCPKPVACSKCGSTL